MVWRHDSPLLCPELFDETLEVVVFLRRPRTLDRRLFHVLPPKLTHTNQPRQRTMRTDLNVVFTYRASTSTAVMPSAWLAKRKKNVLVLRKNMSSLSQGTHLSCEKKHVLVFEPFHPLTLDSPSVLVWSGLGRPLKIKK